MMKWFKYPMVARLQAGQGLGILVAVSAVLHGGLLLLPMPQWWQRSAQPKPEIFVEESDAISVTILPVVSKPVPEEIPPVEPSPPPAPPEVVQPPPLTQVPDNLDKLSEEQLVLEDLEAKEQPDPDPSPEENEPEQQEPEPENSEPEAGIAVQFSSNFPHLAGTETGCYGLENCRRAEGPNYLTALDEISKGLEAQGYELTPYNGNDDSDVRNHKIYEMRLPNDPDTAVKYLNVFADGFKAAIYIITPRIITQAELQALETES
ncbi:MAG: hypothetical protein AAF572_05850 [Cyanobacteria bacterium P01_B01_bin.77]